MSHSDIEVHRLENDKLGRTRFVERVVQDITTMETKKSSCVLGITGSWGDGKSTVGNFIEEKVEAEQDILFLSFNPWQLSNDSQIMKHLFKDLIVVLDRLDGKEKFGLLEQLAEYLEYLEYSHEVLFNMRSKISSVMVFIFGGASVSTLISWIKEFNTFFLLSFFALLVSLFGLIFFEKVVGSLIVLARFFKIRKLKANKTLGELKDDIREKLSLISKKIIIAIDDIDRLDPDEIKALFKVIKVNADFPNLVYILFFDRSIVEKSLGHAEVYEGRRYLEKIVNVLYPLPLLDNKKFIQKDLTFQLDHLFSEFGLLENFDNGRWQEVYFRGLDHIFKNLRDVNRFIQSLRSSIQSFIVEEKLEICIIDLVALEALKLFYPLIFIKIFDNKDIFTSDSETCLNKENAKKRIEEMLSVCEGSKNEIESILEALFPNAAWTWSNVHMRVSPEGFADKRVNDEDVFERYFSNFIGEGDFTSSFFEKALESLKNPEEFVLFCLELKSKNELSDFLSKFFSYIKDIDKDEDSAFEVLDSLYRVSELLNDRKDGFFTFSEKDHLSRLIHWYFKKQDFEFDRRKVFDRLIQEGGGVSEIIFDLYDEFHRINEKERGGDYYIYNLEDKDLILDKIKLLFEKFEKLESPNKIKRLPNLIRIWLEIDPEKASVWFENYLKEDENFIAFLTLIEFRSIVSQGKKSWYEYYISETFFNEFFKDKLGVIERVKKIKKEEKVQTDSFDQILNNLENLGRKEAGRPL